ncbi:hypothetical protein SK128_022748, partial [Halocaridina rubra]
KNNNKTNDTEWTYMVEKEQYPFPRSVDLDLTSIIKFSTFSTLRWFVERIYPRPGLHQPLKNTEDTVEV